MRVVCLLVTLMLAGCSESNPVEPGDPPPPTTFRLAYEVVPVEPNAAAGVDVIRFTGANGQVGETGNLTLPVRIPITIPADVDRVYELSATLTAGGNRAGMAARITVDGVVVSEQVIPGTDGGLSMTRTARAIYRVRPE